MNSPLRILHLEDDPNDAYLIQKALRREGIVADVTAVDSRAGFEAALAEDSVDLVLADYLVPGFDGPEALILVRERYPRKPFIFVTGAMGEEVAVETLKSGATDFVLKDRLSRLPLAVRRALAEAQEHARRQEAEALLRQNEALLRAITDASPDPIFLKNREGRLLMANRATLAVIGKPAEEVLGKTAEQFFGDGALAILETDQRVMASGKTEVVEEIIPGPDGPRVFLSTRSPYSDASGQVIGLVGVARDITERKRTEDALRESEERLRQSLQAGRMFAFSWDFATDRISRSAHCTEILGLEKREATELSREELLAQMHPGDREGFLEVLRQLTPAVPTYRTTYRVLAPDGALIHVEESGRATFDAQGRVMHIIGVTADVTAREQTRLALEWELGVNEALSRVSAPLISPETTMQEVADAVLDEALKLTDSAHGVVSSIHPVTKAAHCHSLTRMRAGVRQRLSGEKEWVVFACGPDGCYPGLWGHALNTGHAFFTNEPSHRHGASTGLPDGHVSIEKLLAMPVFLGKQLVGLIMVANPKRDYTTKDLSAIGRLAGHYALAIQRLRFRQALQTEKDFIQAIVTTAGALVIVADTQGRIVQFNQACEKTTGYTFSEVAGRIFWDLFVTPEELAQVKGVFATLAAGQFPSYHENYWVTRDGRRRRILWSNTALLNEDRSVQHVIATGLDVTQTREAEGKLRVLTRAIEAGPSSVIITDSSGTISYVNPTFAHLTGYSPEEVLGQNPRLWKSGHHSAEFYANLWRRLSQGLEWRGEFCNKTKDGQVFWIYSTISPIKNEAGGISHYVAVTVDITERKGYEHALQQARKELEEKVLERTADLELTVETLQREVQARERAERDAQESLKFERLVTELSTGFTNLTAGQFEAMMQEGIRRLMEFLKAERSSLDELAGEEIRPTVCWCAEGIPPVPDRIPARDLPWSLAQVRRGQAICYSELDELPAEAALDRENYRKFGTKSLVALPLVVSGETIGTLVFATTTTTRQWPQQTIKRLRLVAELFAGLLLRWRSEKALSDAEIRFRAVTDFMRDWEYWESPSGAMPFCSPACERITGYKPEQFLVEPKLLNELVLAEDRRLWDEFHREALRTPEPRTLQFRIRRPDGEIRWIEHRSQPVFDKRGTFLGLRASNCDYSAAKEAELASQRLREDLARVTRMTTVDHLAASLAHELRQPLAAILSNAEAAEQFLAQRPPDLNEVHEALGDIVENDLRAAQVIQRLRALYRRTGQERSTLDLNQLVDETLALLRSELILRQVSCRQSLTARSPRVAANRVEMQQVLMNLVFNAADAMSGNPSDVRGLVISTTDEEPGRVRVSLRDAGTGIRPEDAARIFEPFFTTKESGMGMGLAISRSIIEAHGGRLWVESNPIRGATFHFSLPIAE